MDIFNDPITGSFEDKLFSPLHVHMPSEFYDPASNESAGHCGLQHQYGMNESNIPEFFDSAINWCDLPREDSISQKPGSTVSNSRENGSGSDSDMETTNIPVNNHL